MNTHQLSNSQFAWISAQAQNGVSLNELCREYGVSVSAFHQMKNGTRSRNFSSTIRHLLRF